VDLNTWDVETWIAVLWLVIGMGSGLSSARQWNFESHEIRDVCQAKKLSASQKDPAHCSYRYGCSDVTFTLLVNWSRSKPELGPKHDRLNVKNEARCLLMWSDVWIVHLTLQVTLCDCVWVFLTVLPNIWFGVFQGCVLCAALFVRYSRCVAQILNWLTAYILGNAIGVLERSEEEIL